MKETVLITGASRGIGRATAELFAQNGHPVIINYNHSRESAMALACSINTSGGRAIAIQADVSDRAQVERMFDEIQMEFGGVDILVNNAAVARQNLFTDIQYFEWRETFATNVDGMFHCTQLALKNMLHNHSGCIVNISSMWGQVGASCEVLYSATKAAVIGMTKALAKELGPSGIRVNCVAPGVIDTDMNSALSAEDMEMLREETPLMRIGSPQDVANAIYYLSSDNASFITGQIICPNGGYII